MMNLVAARHFPLDSQLWVHVARENVASLICFVPFEAIAQ
jgi:hypothetical protein